MTVSTKDKTINYIEFVVSDISACKNFYGKCFGWTFTDYGPDYCEFSDGHMTGGFTTEGTVLPGGPLIVLYAQNLEEAFESVQSTGAKITKEIFSFPGGRRFEFCDPDGYKLAVWSE